MAVRMAVTLTSEGRRESPALAGATRRPSVCKRKENEQCA
jgi:hypothetical protein